MKTLSSSVIALVALFSLAGQAEAATASLYVEQKSSNQTYGEWILEFPNGGDYTSALKTKIVSNLDAGSYKLSVRPPANAYANIKLYEGGVMRKESNLNSLVFSIEDGKQYRATVSYTYKGTVEVFSEPNGVQFEMSDMNGNVFTGKTPATFTDMAPISYRVTYGLEPSCEAKKSQERVLHAGSKLTFYADIDCGDVRIPTSGKTAKPLANNQAPVVQTPESTHTDSPAQRVLQTSSMSEVVAGGRVRMTISVRNVTRETLHNVQVTDRFSPDMVNLVMPLSDGGVVNDNLIEWNIPKIYAGQTWTTSFDLVAKDHLVPGDRIVLLAHATSDENDFNLYPEAWSSVAGIKVAHMPQTGGKYDVLFAAIALLGATLITNLTIRTKQHVA